MADSYPILLKPIGDPSVFTSVLEQHPLEALSAEFSNSNSGWHPNITVYRFLIISTTISLGSAKAIATLHGKSYISITIEWVAGVAVFCLLSSLISHLSV
jgi:p-aminobenzoyl-glutamate transporter AbgT